MYEITTYWDKHRGESTRYVGLDHGAAKELYDDIDVEDEWADGYNSTHAIYVVEMWIEDTCLASKQYPNWCGEGWYRFVWSDGPQFGNDVWLEYPDQLAAELASAKRYETDTHLIGCEYIGY